MQSYEATRFEEKRVRNIIGSTIYGMAALTSISAIIILLTNTYRFRNNANMLYTTVCLITEPLFILCNLKNVKQWQYRLLGSVLLFNAIYTVAHFLLNDEFMFYRNDLLAIILGILSIVITIPMILPMENRILYFLRPISIVKSHIPTASPQMITMMPHMVSPHMIPMAYPTMSPHAGYTVPSTSNYPPPPSYSYNDTKTVN